MIGLFDRDGDMIRLHPELPGYTRDRRQRDHHFRPLVRDLILRDALNYGLWDSTEGARDLTRALAWYLAQDPLQPPASWNEPGGVDVAQERQFTSGERIFSNDTRWGAFDRWATSSASAVPYREPGKRSWFLIRLKSSGTRSLRCLPLNDWRSAW